MSLIELSLDLGEMQEYEALPDGPYNAEVRDVETKVSEKIPTGYFVLSLMVPVEEFPADYDATNAPEGVPLTYARVKIPTAEDRRSVKPFKTLLSAMGIEATGTSFDPQDWVGKQVQVLLKADEYQGVATNQVEAIGPVPSV